LTTLHKNRLLSLFFSSCGKEKPRLRAVEMTLFTAGLRARASSGLFEVSKRRVPVRRFGSPRDAAF
jgi:hypothetical protein